MKKRKAKTNGDRSKLISHNTPQWLLYSSIKNLNDNN